VDINSSLFNFGVSGILEVLDFSDNPEVEFDSCSIDESSGINLDGSDLLFDSELPFSENGSNLALSVSGNDADLELD
jgi:hypothetical protein